MQPNILFILIDGLRADQFFGKNKRSYTPFFDSLIAKGVYFENTFSSSDGTTISLNCTLNSRFQFETGIRARKLVLFDDKTNCVNGNKNLLILPKCINLTSDVFVVFAAG